MEEMNLKQEPRPANQATTSLISAVIGWVCLAILVFLVNAEMGIDLIGYGVPLLICLVLIVALPYTAILRGVKAIQAGTGLKAGQKAMAWAGIVLGGLLCVVVLGYFFYALKVT